jgi:hypothetical protein
VEGEKRRERERVQYEGKECGKIGTKEKRSRERKGEGRERRRWDGGAVPMRQGMCPRDRRLWLCN